MATKQKQGATQRTRSQSISSITRAALALSGLAGLAGSLDQVACHVSSFLGVPARAALETLPSILLASRHILQPCALGHLRLLEGLLQISISCWQVILTLAGVAARSPRPRRAHGDSSFAAARARPHRGRNRLASHCCALRRLGATHALPGCGAESCRATLTQNSRERELLLDRAAACSPK